MVEHEADEGDGEDSAEGQGDVEEVVDFGGEREGMQEVRVLGAERGDEVVDAGHLEDGEEGYEEEPWSEDLLARGEGV